MNAEPILIGADVGTTNIKVVAFDGTGRALEGASSPTPTHFPKPGRAHYDPNELWNSLRRPCARSRRSSTTPDA